MMFIQTWGGAFNESLMNLWGGFISFVPSLLGAIILFIIGWVIGSFIGKAVEKIIDERVTLMSQQRAIKYRLTKFQYRD